MNEVNVMNVSRMHEELTRLRQVKAELLVALDKIAYKPLAGGDPKASLNNCFNDAVRIAKAAVDKHGKEA